MSSTKPPRKQDSLLRKKRRACSSDGLSHRDSPDRPADDGLSGISRSPSVSALLHGIGWPLMDMLGAGETWHATWSAGSTRPSTTSLRNEREPSASLRHCTVSRCVLFLRRVRVAASTGAPLLSVPTTGGQRGVTLTLTPATPLPS